MRTVGVACARRVRKSSVLGICDPLTLVLDFVVRDDLCIARGWRAIARTRHSITVVSVRNGVRGRSRRSVVVRGTVAHVRLSSWWFRLSTPARGTRCMSAPILLVVNDHIRHATTTTAIAVSTLPLADTLVVVVIGLGILGDYVPRVEQTGDVAQDAEEDIDYGVSGTDAALDPDCAVRSDQVRGKVLYSK